MWCPIPAETYPDAALVQEWTDAWVDRYGLGGDEMGRTRLKRIGCGALAAIWYPRAAHLDLARLSADVCNGLAAADDWMDTPRRSMTEVVAAVVVRQRLYDAPASTPLDDAPLTVALADITRRVASCSHPDQQVRIAEAFRNYASATLWELANEVEGVTPSLGHYTAMRRHFVAAACITALYETVGGYHLTSQELAAPAVRARSGDHFGDWSNGPFGTEGRLPA